MNTRATNKRHARQKLDRILIGGLPWTITFVDELFLDNGLDALGTTDCELRTIKIFTGVPPHLQLQTLWHECIHAALYMSGHSQTLQQQPHLEEAIVVALENLLYPLIVEFWKRAEEMK